MQQIPSTQRRGAFAALLRAARPVVLGYGLLGCGLLVVRSSEFDPLSPQLRALLKVLLAAMLLSVAATWWAPAKWRRWAPDLTAAAAGAYAGLVIAAALHGTPYPMSGINLDVGFRVEAVARFADTWRLADLTYQGLPAAYPPALTYVTGRTAWLLGLPPYVALKYAQVLAACAVPVLAYVLWRRVLPATHAALICLAAFVTELSGPLVQKPGEWLALFLIVPWWLEAVYEIRNPAARRWPLWVHGIIGALLFCTYYYFYFILAIALLLAPALDRWHPPRPRVWRRRLSILGAAALLSSVYWGPLLVSIVQVPDPAFTQTEYFIRKSAKLPFPMFSLSILGAVLIGGLCHAVWNARRNSVAAGLVLLTLAGYAWYALGLLGAAAGHPVLVHRAEQFILLVLTVTGIRMLFALAHYIARQWSYSDASRVSFILGLTIVFFVTQQYAENIVTGEGVKQAHNEELPSGELPQFHTAEAKQPTTASLNELRAAVAPHSEAGPGHPVVVADNSAYDLLKITPLYGFNQRSSIYANPAAQFDARRSMLRRLAQTDSPGRFARVSAYNRFDQIDMFVLRVTDRGLRYRYYNFDFPRGGGPVNHYFSRDQFPARFWEVTRLDGYVVAVRRT